MGAIVASVVGVVGVGSQVLARVIDVKTTPLGITTNSLITIGVNSSASGPVERIQEVIERLTNLPGMVAVGSWSGRMLKPGSLNSRMLIPDGWQGQIEDIEAFGADVGFFRVLQLPILAGVLPTEVSWRTERLAVVSEKVARRYWPEGPWVGRSLVPLHPRESDGPYVVVAVVADARCRGAEEVPAGAVFIQADPAAATTTGELVARTVGRAHDNLDAAVRAVGDSGAWKIAWAATGDELTNESLRFRRLAAGLASAFGSIGLITVLVAVFGLLALEIQNRQKELAIRSCVGARILDIAWLLVKTAVAPISVAIAMGFSLALWASQTLAGDVLSVGFWPLLTGATTVVLVVAAATAAPILRWQQGSLVFFLRSDT